MKEKNQSKEAHHCEAVVLTCIDFRFWKKTLEFLEKDLGLSNFDFPSLPGSAKAINEADGENDLAFLCVKVPCELHKVRKIIIVNHEDCGAYGGSGKFQNKKEEQEFHEKELKKAEKKLKEKYPDREYILIYARFDEKKEKIEFVRVSSF
jgi:carbonic anhydrase